MNKRTEGIDPSIACHCQGRFKTERICVTEKPEAETSFGIEPKDYLRFYDQCKLCGHWFGRHCLNMKEIYEGSYVNATYGERLEEVFKKIINLSEETSDNANRAQRISKFYDNLNINKTTKSLLDIGSGTGVFPYAMKKLGWNCLAIDPDPKACEHIVRNVNIPVICGDFLKLENSNLGSYDLITINKVIEHVERPIEILAKLRGLLTQTGVAYIEVPDGDASYKADKLSEEFFIEHHHVFSFTSLSLVIERSGLNCLEIKRIKEPSGKNSLFCFAKK